MAEMILQFGRRLFVSTSRQTVRSGVVPLLGNILTVAGVVFALELLVILLGIQDVFLPLTQETLRLLSHIRF